MAPEESAGRRRVMRLKLLFLFESILAPERLRAILLKFSAEPTGGRAGPRWHDSARDKILLQLIPLQSIACETLELPLLG